MSCEFCGIGGGGCMVCDHWYGPVATATQGRQIAAICRHCLRLIEDDRGAWVDATGGDVCGWDGGNEPHEPGGSLLD
jgi:hypothetical protein